MKEKKPNQNKQDKDYKNFINSKINEYNNNGKKTIVYFCDTFYPLIDGVIKVLDNYAINMSKSYNVVVVVPKHKNKVVTKKKEYLVIGVSGMYFKFVNYDLAFPDVDKFLKSTLKNLRIDIIHAHSPFNMGKYASALAKKRKVPFVMTMHSQYKYDFMKYTKNESIVNMLLNNIVKVFSKSDEVWTMHEKVADALRSYGYKGKFFFVPNATDYPVPKNPQQYEEFVNNKYNLPKDLPVFLFVGRLVLQKNLLFILDALKILSDNNIDFRMFFIGDGPDKDELKKRIKENQLTGKVILTGRIDNRNELFSFYQRSNLFLFPSLYDTSSIVQIEAATFKTPGVFIKDTVTAKTITNNHNGYTSENNVEDFAKVIMHALDNKEELKQIGENAFKELYINYDDVAKIISDRYEYLIEKNNNKLRKLDAINKLKKDKKLRSV